MDPSVPSASLPSHRAPAPSPGSQSERTYLRPPQPGSQSEHAYLHPPQPGSQSERRAGKRDRRSSTRGWRSAMLAAPSGQARRLSSRQQLLWCSSPRVRHGSLAGGGRMREKKRGKSLEERRKSSS